MYQVNSKLLGLVALGSFCCAAPANAANRALTPDEAQIAKAVDTAVREDATLKSFSDLPWVAHAEIFGPEILRDLKSCKPSSAWVYNGILTLSWDEPTDTNQKCGHDGYYVNLKLKNGRIKRATFGESQYILTSGKRPKVLK